MKPEKKNDFPPCSCEVLLLRYYCTTVCTRSAMTQSAVQTAAVCYAVFMTIMFHFTPAPSARGSHPRKAAGRADKFHTSAHRTKALTRSTVVPSPAVVAVSTRETELRRPRRHLLAHLGELDRLIFCRSEYKSCVYLARALQKCTHQRHLTSSTHDSGARQW